MKHKLPAITCLLGQVLAILACGPANESLPQTSASDSESHATDQTSTTSQTPVSSTDETSLGSTSSGDTSDPSDPSDSGSTSDTSDSSSDSTSIPGDLVTEADGKPILDAVLVPAGLFWRGCKSTTPEGDDGGKSESLLPRWPNCQIDKCSACNDSRDQPYEQIELSEYEIGKYEVTAAQYRQCVLAGACESPKTEDPHDPDTINCSYNFVDEMPTAPITCVNWYQAESFCKWVGWRLPTEAEWEKAARGTDHRIRPWDGLDFTCDHAVVDEATDQPNAENCDTFYLWLPVGSRPLGASPYGAMDMFGNVGEWVGDAYEKDYYKVSPKKDPPGPPLNPDSPERVTRDVRAQEREWGLTVRGRAHPLYTSNVHIGFRCARSR